MSDEQRPLDSVALDEVRQVLGRETGPLRLLHYLYFNSAPSASEAGNALARRGLIVKVEPSAWDDQQTVVLATQDITLDDEAVLAARAMMESVAEAHGGEYDGWEVDTTSTDGTS